MWKKSTVRPIWRHVFFRLTTIFFTLNTSMEGFMEFFALNFYHPHEDMIFV